MEQVSVGLRASCRVCVGLCESLKGFNSKAQGRAERRPGKDQTMEPGRPERHNNLSSSIAASLATQNLRKTLICPTHFDVLRTRVN